MQSVEKCSFSVSFQRVFAISMRKRKTGFRKFGDSNMELPGKWQKLFSRELKKKKFFF